MICRGLLIRGLAAGSCILKEMTASLCRLTHKPVGSCQLISTQCALKFSLTVEAAACSQVPVQLPEQGSPVALIISFIYQRGFHTPVNIKLIISNKWVNKFHLQNDSPQMNPQVHNRARRNYINAGSCGGCNVSVLPCNSQSSWQEASWTSFGSSGHPRQPLDFRNLSLPVYINGLTAWVHRDKPWHTCIHNM